MTTKVNDSNIIYFARFLDRCEASAKSVLSTLEYGTALKDSSKQDPVDNIERFLNVNKFYLNIDSLSKNYESLKGKYGEDSDIFPNECQSRIDSLVKMAKHAKESIEKEQKEKSQILNEKTTNQGHEPVPFSSKEDVNKQSEKPVPGSVKSESDTQSIDIEELHINVKRESMPKEKLIKKIPTKDPRQMRRDDIDGVDKVIKNQRMMHEELTEDLLRMASALKNNSSAFGNMLKKDEKVLEETSSIISKNLSGLIAQGKKLGKYRSRAWATTGFTWGLVLFVILTMFIMIMFIKVAPKFA
ncbi:hypothetical protein H4219_005179 [Mycoemilia scoparia]|uniref:USE1-like protein n=1 Tax=Mycoemilia scoparia TaxID=417184 RepID=A0A9W7ZNZ0_9FUNG|nr:hypothetical protein H4219_005179 [Mycoemilia scoparia]